jgi:hypothetical protein
MTITDPMLGTLRIAPTMVGAKYSPIKMTKPTAFTVGLLSLRSLGIGACGIQLKAAKRRGGELT